MAEGSLDGPEAMFKQLARILEARITAGTYEVDQPIPSETDLRAEFSVGRTTVRNAVAILAEKKLVVAVQGKGVYVLPKPSAPEA